MWIKIGYNIALRVATPTALLFELRVHPSREHDLAAPENLQIEPFVPVSEYLDVFGNRCGRISVNAGLVRFTNSAVIRDSGQLNDIAPHAPYSDVRELPLDVLPYIQPSRYCDADSELLTLAWNQFGNVQGGWNKVQAICTFVYNHLQFDYQRARSNRTALESFRERTGVCRDFTHLAITLCRALNIPARYATGYLGDIGVPIDPAPMDFSAWFEAYVGGRWYAFDPRHNTRRIGMIPMAFGKDAGDCALTTVFSLHTVETFQVTTYEVSDPNQ
jgi:transglutaminase-like putative cysteine protease